MSFSSEIVECFHSQVAESFGGLVESCGLVIEKTSEESCRILVRDFELRIYMYPGHVPTVNVTFMPTSSDWRSWRSSSRWGGDGIWLFHFVKYHDPDFEFPKLTFKTTGELRMRIQLLFELVNKYAFSFLQGNTSVWSNVANFADERIERREKQAEVLGILSSRKVGRNRGQ